MSGAVIALRPRRAWRLPRVATVVGALILLGLLACAAVPERIAPYLPTAFDFRALLKPPSLAHPFGTDNFGRDILSRTIWAARIDLQIAVFSTVFAAVFGTLVGCVVGYVGGWADAVFRRVVDVFVTIPFLVLVIAIVAVLGPGLRNMYVAISAVNWIVYARLMRAEVRAQARLDYAAAGRVMGYGTMRIMFRHLLPNAVSPLVVYWMTDMALAILLGSSLGYLGLGAQPPAAEWGVLIADGKNFMTTAWWMSIFPGIAIVIAGTGFSLLGDGLAGWLGTPGLSLLSLRGVGVAIGAARPVDGIDLDIGAGEVMGIVGESGSGKSLTLRAILRLLPPAATLSGQVLWRGQDLVTLSEPAIRAIRGREIAMVFQEPMTALNPVLTIGLQITESLAAHLGLRGRAATRRAAELLDLVGIPGAVGRLGSYPHEFSGGMRQRAMIAIALASGPKLLLADEPTTALDVTIQDQILKLLLRLKAELGMAVAIVTHDLGVVAGTCDRVAVMYAGQVLETGAVDSVLRDPAHAYTLGLLGSLPGTQQARQRLVGIPGSPPDLADPAAVPPGCRFAPRCSFVRPECEAAIPPLARVAPGHASACIRAEAVRAASGAVAAA